MTKPMPADAEPQSWLHFLRRHWFVLALLAVVVSTGVTEGTWQAPWQEYLQQVATACIFFVTGLTLTWRALLSWRSFLLVVVPLAVWTFAVLPGAFFLWQAVAFPVHVGWGVLAVMPIAITSCVALTVVARGDSAPAVQAAVVINLLGLLVVPLWLQQLIPTGPLSSSLWLTIGGLVLCPLLLGLAAQRLLWLQPARQRAGLITQIALLLLLAAILLHTEHFQLHMSLLTTACLAAVIHLIILAILWFGARRWPVAWRPTLVFCGGQKSIATGLPLLALVASDPAPFALPLIMYHLVQLLIDAPLAVHWGSKQHET